MVGLTSIPRQLQLLLGEKFFIPCLVHSSEKKSEKNIFCLGCCISLCPHCLPPHRHHRLLQIRRYVYQDVIRLNDAQKLMNCSFVQAYTTNSAKVVFLNRRPAVARQFRGGGNACIVCDRSLQDPYLFCSLSCKVHQMGDNEIGVTKHHFCDSELEGVKVESYSELEAGQMTPNSVLELPIPVRTSSGSSSSSIGSPKNCTRPALACAMSIDFAKRKRSAVPVSRNRYRKPCAPAAEFSDIVNRRKRVPHRSPLY